MPCTRVTGVSCSHSVVPKRSPHVHPSSHVNCPSPESQYKKRQGRYLFLDLLWSVPALSRSISVSVEILLFLVLPHSRRKTTFCRRVGSFTSFKRVVGVDEARSIPVGCGCEWGAADPSVWISVSHVPIFGEKCNYQTRRASSTLESCKFSVFILVSRLKWIFNSNATREKLTPIVLLVGKEQQTCVEIIFFLINSTTAGKWCSNMIFLY